MSDRDHTNVVSLANHSRGKELAPHREVESYWTGLLQDGDVPLRSEVDPRSIQNALEYSFIAERVTSTMSRLRVAGAHLSDLLGMSVSGMPLACLFTAEARATLAEATDKLFNEPAAIHLELTSDGATPMTGEMVLLPLRSDLGDVTRALGCLVTQGRIHRAPRRFDITRVRIRPISILGQEPAEDKVEEILPTAADSLKSTHLQLIVSND